MEPNQFQIKELEDLKIEIKPDGKALGRYELVACKKHTHVGPKLRGHGRKKQQNLCALRYTMQNKRDTTRLDSINFS